MLGIIVSLLAGICMSFQGVFNTRLGEKIGLWETNVIVQASGLIITIIAVCILGNGGFKNIKNCNKLYLLGGVLGVIIIYTVMQGIKSLGPTCSISIILVAQLTTAALIDAFGLFDTTQVKFGVTKIIGVIIMIIGILIFKYKY
ncbi:DMT family transporter [Clostridium thailandense]|uniref:DMT family transporter n=1 Tax=Clostridium thailandense TaxID=2794346 RepID=A0A949WQW8_9CLOT|nr:DMT family transporter [Clostridium thailandense]MBV7273276.1 DMT family transporter [Clostridium thailandense]MCH5137301.1 DMT family transporter [Clostridiaceae bacterium UIB06]